MNTEDSSELSNFSLLNNMNAGDSIEVAILRGRDALPSHFLFKIEPFSLLKASIDIYKTSQFEAGGFKRRLLIYPAGESSKNRENHISIYLELMETSSLPARWEVNVIFNFLIFNQLQDKRYHAMKTEWGITKFIDLKAFHNPLKGYHTDHTCVFGAEVFVVKIEQVFSPILLNWDARKFMSLHKLKDPKQSFLVDNTCIIEAEVTVLGLIKT
ncbi:hypothetical protein Pint_31517 [Pistacia integerrima]|uniref:Uncharacterized protein n=1 Tax=Pistacia integerrima TaxID=434235 RepID=A0ACC0XR54_9ROSI|nr:hypothetical protein Pint_31517 [Pistacia integerrima]